MAKFLVWEAVTRSVEIEIDDDKVTEDEDDLHDVLWEAVDDQWTEYSSHTGLKWEQLS